MKMYHAMIEGAPPSSSTVGASAEAHQLASSLSLVLQEATNKNFQGGSLRSNNISLGSLVEVLTQVYEQCGFSSDASVTPLQMLSKIEASTTGWYSGCPPRYRFRTSHRRQHQQL